MVSKLEGKVGKIFRYAGLDPEEETAAQMTQQILSVIDEAVREGKIEVLNRLPEVNDAWAKYHGNMTYAEFALQTPEEERL